MASSTVRFGPGCTGEVGLDLANMGFGNRESGRVLVVTDGTVSRLPVMETVVESLESAGVRWEVFSKVRVEPKDYS